MTIVKQRLALYQLEYLHIPADVSDAFHHLEAHLKSPQPFLAAALKMSFFDF